MKINIGEEINEIENRKIGKKIRSYFFEKFNKTCKALIKLIRKKEEIQTTNIRNKNHY